MLPRPYLNLLSHSFGLVLDILIAEGDGIEHGEPSPNQSACGGSFAELRIPKGHWSEDFSFTSILISIYIQFSEAATNSRMPLILLVGAGRFERPTPCAQGRCATRLRYAPTYELF